MDQLQESEFEAEMGYTNEASHNYYPHPLEVTYIGITCAMQPYVPYKIQFTRRLTSSITHEHGSKTRHLSASCRVQARVRPQLAFASLSSTNSVPSSDFQPAPTWTWIQLDYKLSTPAPNTMDPRLSNFGSSMLAASRAIQANI